MKRIVQVCVSVALVVTSVIVGVLLCEVSYRVAGYSSPVRAPVPSHYPQYYYKTDPVKGYDINENFPGRPFEFSEYIRSYGESFSITSNSLGCRDRPFDREDSYVLLIGDSHTWGYAPLEQTWGTTLEQHLGMRVLKCGVPGYGTRQERHKLESVAAKAARPRLVILGYCMGNDLLDDYLYPNRTVIDGYLLIKAVLADEKGGGRKVRSDDELRTRLKSALKKRSKSVSERQASGFVGRAKDFLADHSVLYDLLRKSEVLRRVAAGAGMANPLPAAGGVEVYHSPATLPWLDRAWEEHLTNLRQLRAAVKAMGADLFVVLMPNSYQVYPFTRPRDGKLDWEYPMKRLVDFFQEEGIAFFDLGPELQRYARQTGSSMLDAREDLFWHYDGHMNVKGNLLTGLLIGRQVLEQPFLELQDKDKRLSDVKKRLSALALMSQ